MERTLPHPDPATQHEHFFPKNWKASKLANLISDIRGPHLEFGAERDVLAAEVSNAAVGVIGLGGNATMGEHPLEGQALKTAHAALVHVVFIPGAVHQVLLAQQFLLPSFPEVGRLQRAHRPKRLYIYVHSSSKPAMPTCEYRCLNC